jgi:formylglycine-generating enzyme
MPRTTMQNAAMSPMRGIALAFFALLAAFAADARAVTIAWSPVGSPGNANDTTGFGSVGYSYNIGTNDVTNSQYVEFLNAKDLTGTSPLQLYNSNMSNATYGGINFTAGNADGTKYSVISGNGNHPVNSATWYESIRFANWLNNGQGNGDTETGAYTLGPLAFGLPINGDLITRNAGATVFLPSENEWYKAAYNIPGTNLYFQYPTSSNTTPTSSSPTALPNHANFSPGGPGSPTDVGAYSGTTSPYGAFDMGGNVFQWNEALISGLSVPFRGLRGGSTFVTSDILLSSGRAMGDPTIEFGSIGFRVVSVPEPSTGVLAILACGMLWWWRKRLK